MNRILGLSLLHSYCGGITSNMVGQSSRQKTVIIGAGPVGALAALYAAQRGDDVEIYELRSGTSQLRRATQESLENLGIQVETYHI